MRDENIPVYGDQPIKYDRYDPMLDWEPPFVAAAEAGQPVPSIEQLRQEVSERLKAREQELAEGEQDLLPVASEDEVMYGRLLEGSFYEGGVKETLKRRAEQAQETAGGGGAATMAAAALTANVEAAEMAGEAAALADAAAAGSSTAALLASSSGSDSLRATADRWPWPSAEEVLDEAAERRAAQRVWVLMGGDGPGRQQALRSGANIVAKLQRCCDLQVRGPGACGCYHAGVRPACWGSRMKLQHLRSLWLSCIVTCCAQISNAQGCIEDYMPIVAVFVDAPNCVCWMYHRLMRSCCRLLGVVWTRRSGVLRCLLAALSGWR